MTPERLPAGTDWVVFALSPRDYENLARAQADALRWATEMTHRLDQCTRPTP